MRPTRLSLAGILLLTLSAFTIPTPARALAVVEICDNCVDDDTDGAVDRKDDDCSAPANGGGLGIGDESEAKAITACTKAVQKAGFKFVLGTMKQFFKCTEAATACILGKPGDPACQAKATAICAQSLGSFDDAAAKLETAIVTKCGAENELVASLRAPTGLGFQAEESQCVKDTGGVITDLQSVQNIASCLATQHFCRAQHLVAIATPRARELLTFAGRPTNEFGCLDERAAANGAGAGVAADHVKKTLKCGKTIDKLALSLIGSGAKTVQGCLSLGTACTQVKPNDVACIAKARAKCTAAFAKLQHPTKGTVAKLAAKLSKACRVQAGLDLADIGQDNGLGLDRLTPRCQALGNGSQFGLPQCLGGQAYCEGAYMIERQVPRARELSDTLGVVIPGIFD